MFNFIQWNNSCTSVLADAHFPSSSICKSGPKEVRADGMCMLQKSMVK